MAARADSSHHVFHPVSSYWWYRGMEGCHGNRPPNERTERTTPLITIVAPHCRRSVSVTPVCPDCLTGAITRVRCVLSRFASRQAGIHMTIQAKLVRQSRLHLYVPTNKYSRNRYTLSLSNDIDRAAHRACAGDAAASTAPFNAFDPR